MNVLLDTCTFLWLISDPTKLSAAATKELNDPNNRCWMSIVSSWEIALGISLGRITLAQPVETFVAAQRPALSTWRFLGFFEGFLRKHAAMDPEHDEISKKHALCHVERAGTTAAASIGFARAHGISSVPPAETADESQRPV